MNIETQLKDIEADVNEIKENVTKVYDAGKTKEWSDFWDVYQNFGKSRDGFHKFSGNGWTDKNFKPKYDVIIGHYGFQNSHITDLKQRLIEAGVTCKLQISNGAVSNNFSWSNITHIPDLSGQVLTGKLDYTFGHSIYLHTIDGLRVSATATFPNTFNNNNSLKNITIYGTIGTSIDFRWSPLTVKSCKSIINALKNYAGTSKALSNKLTLKSECWTALNEAETPPSGNTWQEYVQSLGWLYYA